MSSSRFNLSLGATQLASARGTLREKAAALGITERSVSNYCNGSRVPTDAAQAKAESAYGIAREAWITTSTAPTRPATPAEAADPSPESSAREPIQTPGSAVAEIKSQIERLTVRRESGQLSERALLEIEKLLAALNRDLARLRGIDSDVVKATQVWRDLEATIAAALKNEPAALFKVIDAINGNSARLDGLRERHPAEVLAGEQASATLVSACEARAKRAQ